MDVQTTGSQPSFIEYGLPYEHRVAHTIPPFHMSPVFEVDDSVVIAYWWLKRCCMRENSVSQLETGTHSQDEYLGDLLGEFRMLL